MSSTPPKRSGAQLCEMKSTVSRNRASASSSLAATVLTEELTEELCSVVAFCAPKPSRTTTPSSATAGKDFRRKIGRMSVPCRLLTAAHMSTRTS
ncbi:hypothetical protein [Streptomyces sp. NPDC057438]|uniref:hypothetical protein n=1 Tax=Streptomyces sp. NPDC057438 TaxID=3346133 RepID=UPI003686A898